MNAKNLLKLVSGVAWVSNLVFWVSVLAISGYADLASGLLALVMVASGIWFSAKGMAQLKQHEAEALPETALESAYRYRNAGIALGLTGSGLLVFSMAELPRPLYCRRIFRHVKDNLT